MQEVFVLCIISVLGGKVFVANAARGKYFTRMGCVYLVTILSMALSLLVRAAEMLWCLTQGDCVSPVTRGNIQWLTALVLL